MLAQEHDVEVHKCSVVTDLGSARTRQMSEGHPAKESCKSAVTLAPRLQEQRQLLLGGTLITRGV